MAVDTQASRPAGRRSSAPSHGPVGGGRRRRRLVRGSVPYFLLLPTIVVVAAVLGYPLWKLVDISFRHYGFAQIVGGKAAPRNGTLNYRTLFKDDFFWTVLERTVIWTAIVVVATVVIGLALALLMERVSRSVRIALTFTLVAAWSMPRVVATEMWKWMTDYQFGVLNYTFDKLGLHQFAHYNWFVPTRPTPGLILIGVVVVWGALPFVVITLYASLTQVPKELVEAATVDGAGAGMVFRMVTIPILRPVLVIVTSLSIIWDFGVFDQIYIMGDNVPDKAFWLMGVYAYSQAFRQGNFGFGAAISIVMVVILLVVTVFYIRQMIKLGETE
ncbi:MAG: N,N-diacetylchitobiose transport system permease protein [Frankiales bacterium]|jgi:N,N'-diacetylchitobiose transport system permease protein|nr:N,N-diacetylchitobiose transport system permease protein [Frankiales bacterium]